MLNIKSFLFFSVFLIPLFFTTTPLAAMLEEANKKLYAGIKNDNLDEVITALNAGADINNKSTDFFRQLPIENAAEQCCHPNILIELFARGAHQPTPTDPLVASLLHLLIEGRHVTKPHFFETIKTILQHKVSIHSKDSHNNTPLHNAIKIYKKIVTCSKNSYCQKNKNNHASLFYHAIQFLLFSGANDQTKNDKNKKALDLIDQKHQAPIERLIDLTIFFSLPKNLPNLLPLHLQVPGLPTIIVDYLNPQPTEKEQKLWNELTPIRDIQQELLMAPQNTLSEEEKQYT